MDNSCYFFFFDESGHSRKITKETINADNYRDDYVAFIVGAEKDKISIIEQEYVLMEKKYKDYYQVDELKSTLFSPKKYKYGFATFKPKDIAFFDDVFDFILRHNLLIYCFVSNKIEWIIVQALKDYFNKPIYNSVSIEYALTKVISTYRPEKVINAFYDKDSNIILYLREFLFELVKKHAGIENRQIENKAIYQLIQIIDSLDLNIDINWKYNPTFEKFEGYLKENDVCDCELFLDKEGSGENIKAASSIFKNSSEVDSRSSPLVRLADIMAGLISSFINAIHNNIVFRENDDPHLIKTLNIKWFKLTSEQFKCYQKLKLVFIDLHNTYNKVCGSRYGDCLLYLISLLIYISNYPNTNLLAQNNNCPLELNSYVIRNLTDEFNLQNSEWLARRKK